MAAFLQTIPGSFAPFAPVVSPFAFPPDAGGKAKPISSETTKNLGVYGMTCFQKLTHSQHKFVSGGNMVVSGHAAPAARRGRRVF